MSAVDRTAGESAADRTAAVRSAGRNRPGALLMTYGSPDSLRRDDVGAYLARVRGGREAAAELLDEFTRRYRAIGGSPLIEITRHQAAALSASLGWPVAVGMQFSAPSIEMGLRSLGAEGVTDVAAIILSPQFSPLLMGGYSRGIAAAREAIGSDAPAVAVAGSWHDEPAFVAGLAGGLRDALDELRDEGRDDPTVLMTAHSLPKRVAEQEPAYLGQLRDTARAVAIQAGLPSRGWTFCWQSAGHEPGDWMKPDFADLMPEIAADGGRAVIVLPVQFLADHLETLYDVDIGAREQAERHGLAFRRVPSLNTDPRLISALASVADRTLNASKPVGAISSG